MALNPVMKPVLGEKHRALLAIKSGDPDTDGYIRSMPPGWGPGGL